MTHTCRRCKNEIKEGTICIRPSDLRRYEDDYKEWSKENDERWLTAKQLGSIPDVVTWQILCDNCHEELGHDTDCYWFDLEKIDTPLQMLLTTAHLMEKRWIGHTNWSSLIYSKYGQAQHKP